MTTRKASLKERIVLAACKLNEKSINELTCISTGGGLVMLVSLFDKLWMSHFWCTWRTSSLMWATPRRPAATAPSPSVVHNRMCRSKTALSSLIGRKVCWKHFRYTSILVLAMTCNGIVMNVRTKKR